MARFFLPTHKIRDHRGIIDGQEFDHLRKVLRLKSGDHVTVFDDRGWEHEAVIRSLSPSQGEVEILSSFQAQRESSLRVTLAVGLTKGDKLDYVVEKATELGVHTVAPFVSNHAVPKLDERKIAARRLRWEKIALGAVKQSGRTLRPEILPLRSFTELVAQVPSDAVKLFFWEQEAKQSLRRVYEAHREVSALVLLIGPEGGFSAEEVDWARRHGCEFVGLGRRILRAETAALTALALVQFLWGDLA